MIASIIGGAVVILALWFGGIPLMLGAHPFWANSVIWIGGGFGLATALAIGKRASLLWVALAVVLTIGSYMIATTGQNAFAASYGDDAIAGRMWHFGWIAACAFATCGGAFLLRSLLGRD